MQTRGRLVYSSIVSVNPSYSAPPSGVTPISTTRAWATIDGEVTPLVNFSFGNTVNQGWGGSIVLKYGRMPFGDSDLVVRIFVEQKTGAETVRVESGKMTFANKGREQAVGRAGSNSSQLVDWALKKLAKPGQSFPTFQATTSDQVYATLAAGSGVRISGLPKIRIPLEDVKQSKPLDGIRRMLAVDGSDFVIDQTGRIVCTAAAQTQGEFPTRAAARLNYAEDDNARVTGLLVERPKAITDQVCFDFATADRHVVTLPYPLVNAQFVDRSPGGGGFFDLIGLWNGDPNGKGKLLGLHNSGIVATDFIVNVPFNGTGPITHLTVNIYTSAFGILTGEEVQKRLCVLGTPWNSDPQDNTPGFSRFLGNNTWPSSDPWSEPLIPSESWAIARQASYIWQRSKTWKTVAADFNRVVAGEVGQKFRGRAYGEDWPIAKVASVNFSGSGTSVKTSLVAHVVTF